MLQIAIIADDLTGAADTGARFAQAGLVTVITLAPGRLPPADELASRQKAVTWRGTRLLAGPGSPPSAV
jgi:uncharacterized protein YgbK (DUF1537 family)